MRSKSNTRLMGKFVLVHVSIPPKIIENYSVTIRRIVDQVTLLFPRNALRSMFTKKSVFQDNQWTSSLSNGSGRRKWQ